MVQETLAQLSLLSEWFSTHAWRRVLSAVGCVSLLLPGSLTSLAGNLNMNSSSWSLPQWHQRHLISQIIFKRTEKNAHAKQFFWVTSSKQFLLRWEKCWAWPYWLELFLLLPCGNELLWHELRSALQHLPFLCITTQQLWTKNVDKFLCLHVVFRQNVVVCFVPA